jgi:aspartate aminotransferase
MAAKARELKENGVDIIGLSLGEPDFNTPNFIKNAAIKAIEDNYNSYTPVDGYLDLKKSICNKFKRDNGLIYEPNQIVVSTGAKQSIANTVQVLVNPGDDVLLVAPYWVSYSAIVTLAGGNPIEIRSDIASDFKITPQQLENSITNKTKMVIINSPNNPSGTVYNQQELLNLAKVLEKYPNIYVLSDEIYEHINYGIPHFSFAKYLQCMIEQSLLMD